MSPQPNYFADVEFVLVADAYRTEPVDLKTATQAVHNLYLAAVPNLEELPYVYFAASPLQTILAGMLSAWIIYTTDPQTSQMEEGLMMRDLRLLQPAACAHAWFQDMEHTVALNKATIVIMLQYPQFHYIDLAIRSAVNLSVYVLDDVLNHIMYGLPYAETDTSVEAGIFRLVTAVTGADRMALIAEKQPDTDWIKSNVDARWIAYDSGNYSRQAAAPRPEAVSNHYVTAARAAGPRYMHRSFCIVSDFPQYVDRGRLGRVRTETTVSGRFEIDDVPDKSDVMVWRDGFGLCMQNGISMPSALLRSPERIKAAMVEQQTNVEVSRILLEHMGWERYCADAEMRVIHEDELHSNFPAIPVSDLVDQDHRLVTAFRPGVEKAQLLQAENLKDRQWRPMRFVRLTDPSTDRQYIIRVLPDHTRCYEAVGWTMGMTEKEYMNSFYIRQGDVVLRPLDQSATGDQRHS